MKFRYFSRIGLAFVALLGGCTSLPQSVPLEGNIYHYIRSNRDGTLPEHVVVFRPSRTTVSVYKWVEKCTTAAYVTATLNHSTQEGVHFIAGKVAKDGNQAPFGTLTMDPQASVLNVNITPPGGSPIIEQWPLVSRPYLLFDFDLADLNSFLQEARPRNDFSFRLPVIWPSEQSIFRDLGILDARYIGRERHLNRDAIRFDLTVFGPHKTSGKLWIDAHSGFIIEADLGLPNHTEYADFLIKLERVQSGGLMAWNALTQGHYKGC